MDYRTKPDPQDILAHHGIKGMKWGVRRFQNEDGSLTEAGRKRVSKQYAKEAVKVTKKLGVRKTISTYVTAHNKTVARMNGGEIDKFNRQQQKKYGDKYAERDDYEKEYLKLFNKILVRNYNEALLEFYENDESYKKATALMEQYGMAEWDELAKRNKETIEGIKRLLSDNE